MTEEDFADDIPETLKNWVQAIGDEYEEDIDGEIIDLPNDAEPHGIWASRGDHRYGILARSDSVFFTILIPMSIVGNLIDLMNDEQIEELSSIDDVSLDGLGVPEQAPDEELRELRAVVAWLDSIEDEVMEEIKFRVRERASSTDVAFDMQTTEEGSLIGMKIERKIFPYEDDFSLAELNRSVQAVVSISTLTSNFLGKTFNIETSGVDEPTLP